MKLYNFISYDLVDDYLTNLVFQIAAPDKASAAKAICNHLNQTRWNDGGFNVKKSGTLIENNTERFICGGFSIFALQKKCKSELRVVVLR